MHVRTTGCEGLEERLEENEWQWRGRVHKDTFSPGLTCIGLRHTWPAGKTGRFQSDVCRSTTDTKNNKTGGYF